MSLSSRGKSKTNNLYAESAKRGLKHEKIQAQFENEIRKNSNVDVTRAKQVIAKKMTHQMTELYQKHCPIDSLQKFEQLMKESGYTN